MQDTRDVVEQAKVLLLSKNEGDLLQDFIWQAQQIDGGNATVPGAPIDQETAKQHGKQALDGLRTLGTLLITNGQFRKLLNDAFILARDIAGDAATKAANKVNPSDDQLAQIDQPATDNTWHEAPDMSNMKQQLRSAVNSKSPLDTDDLRDAVGNATESAHPDGSRDPIDTAAMAARDQQQGTNSGVDAQSGARAGLNTLSDRIPDETKDKAEDRAGAQKERAQKYLSSKMPEDRRDQTIWRLRKMVTECQGHPDCKLRSFSMPQSLKAFQD